MTTFVASAVITRLPVLWNHRKTVAPPARLPVLCWVPLTSTTNGPEAPFGLSLRMVTLTPMIRLLAQPPLQPCGAVMADETTRAGLSSGRDVAEAVGVRVGPPVGVFVRVAVRVGVLVTPPPPR